MLLLLIAAAGALAWQQSQMGELRNQLATQQSMVAQQKTRLDQQEATLATQATQIERQATTMRTLASQVRTKQAVDKLVSSPGAEVATLDSGRVTAHLVSAPNNAKAYLVVNGLPKLAAGRDYQVWLMRDQKPVSVGVFHPVGNGRWVLNAPAPLKAFS
ncbi:MAG: anti-sigma factor [Chloroflexia bacterium]